MKKALLTPVFVLLLGICSAPVAAHPFHVTTAEVELNRETASLEVALRVGLEDLERALSLARGRKVHLETEPDVQDQIEAYVRTHFTVTQQDRQAPFKWVGFEFLPQTAWLYFELSIDWRVDTAILENRLFFSFLPDQIHTVTFKTDGTSTSWRLTSDRSQQTLRWNGSWESERKEPRLAPAPEQAEVFSAKIVAIGGLVLFFLWWAVS